MTHLIGSSGSRASGCSAAGISSPCKQSIQFSQRPVQSGHLVVRPDSGAWIGYLLVDILQHLLQLGFVLAQAAFTTCAVFRTFGIKIRL